MHTLAAADSASAGGLWAYLAIFVLVAIGWAGVPAIGGTVVAGAAVLASQGHLEIGAVLVVSVLGTEAGGLAGYAVGRRWGRAIMDRPGRTLARRQQAVATGEALYAKWGRLAVFFTPCMVSGIAKMKLSQFMVWNLAAGLAYVLSVGPAAYGAGKVATGEQDLGSLGSIIAGIAVAAAVVAFGVRHYRRVRQSGARLSRPATDQSPSA
jgi:membrane-associated protein